MSQPRTSLRSRLTTPFSAVVTSKVAAFSAPLGFKYDDAYYEGSNELSWKEKALASAYDELGRSDLGDCVRQSKKYQRLQEQVGYTMGWTELSSFVQAVTGKLPVETSEEDWLKEARLKFGSDEGLMALLASEADKKDTDGVGRS